MMIDGNYQVMKTQVIKAERRVLKELGFCVHVKHPHKLIVMYLQVLGYETHQDLMQIAWNFMNDSLRTDVFVRYNPESIACACIYLSARKHNLPLPNNPPWYGVFKVTEDEILDISYKIMDLYRRSKPKADVLEQAVEELRKKHNDIRNKNKADQNTPPMAVTTVDRNNGSHNAWGGFISRALPVTTITDNGKQTLPQQQGQLQNSSQSGQTTTTIQQPSQQQEKQQPQQQQQQQSQQQQQQSAPQQQQQQQTHNSHGQKRSHSRSRSRSRSISHSPSEDNRSRLHKKSRHRSRSRSRTPLKYSSSKKKSRNYSRSTSLSPSRHSRKQ